MHIDPGVCGFVYVATGEEYVNEAIASARSLRRFHEEPICLITNGEVPPGHPFSDVICRPELSKSIRSKLEMNLCPYERFIFLDSDTRILSSLAELFHLLEMFDVCVPAALGGYHYQLDGVSSAFREPSTNVIGFRRSEAVEEFFRKWMEYFRKYEKEMGREWDQRSFRHAAYEVRLLRLCFLGDEWSLSPYPGGLLCRDVKILHGRPPQLIAAMEGSVNAKLGYRVFWRGFAIIRDPQSMSFWESIALACQFCWSGIKRPIRLIRQKASLRGTNRK